jgi:death-on-curing protein
VSVRYVTVEEVLAYVERLTQAQGQPMPTLLSLDRLEAAIARPASSAFGEDIFPSLPAKAAALLHGLVTGHPFSDANKRAALGATLLFLELNGAYRPVPDDALYELTMDVATGRERDVERIAGRLEDLFGLGG